MIFHHIGVACTNLDIEMHHFLSLGYLQEGADFHDPVQGVAGRFLVGGGPRMELLAPVGEKGVLRPWLKTGVKLYHVAYEVPDFASSILRLQQQGAKIVVHPVPAVAYSGRNIAFLMLPNLLLCELIEAQRSVP